MRKSCKSVAAALCAAAAIGFPALGFAAGSDATDGCAKKACSTCSNGCDASGTCDADHGNTVAATVDGQPILESDVDAALRKMAPDGINEEGLAALRARYGARVVEGLIGQRLLDEQVKTAAATIGPEEARSAIDAQVAIAEVRSGKTPAEFAEEVKASTGKSLPDWIAERAKDPTLERTLLYRKLVLEKFPAKVAVSDSDVKEFYDANKATMFTTPEMVRASHILIDTRGAKTDAEKAAARKQAEEVLALARKPGADFAALAKERSACPSKAQGGDLGFFGKSDMVAPFAEAAFALEPGEMSGVVESPFGFHVILVTGRKDARVATLPEAAPEIRERLQDEKISRTLDAWVKDLRASAKVVVSQAPAAKEEQGKCCGACDGKTRG